MPQAARAKTKGISERVAEIRKDAGISQAEFGKRVGIRQSAVSKYEKGYPIPRFMRIAIAATFGANLSWLETGQGPKYVKPAEFPVTAHDLELLRFLKQQNSLYDLIKVHLNSAKRAAQGTR